MSNRMVFARQKLTPLQKIGGADYDTDDDNDSVFGGGASGYESDPGRDRAGGKKKNLTYAEFLKAQERSFGPDGAIDANFFKKPTVKRSRSVGSLVDAYAASQDLEQERGTQMRKIEQNIAYTRAKKRDLRRLEGDLNKSQYSIRKSFRKFESVVSNKMDKKDDEIKNLHHSSARSLQEHSHALKKAMTARGQENRSKQIDRSRERRKNDLQLSTVEKAYKAKLAELNLKQLEIQRITHEFTQKLKLKEEEEFKLKKELGELSLTVAFELKKKGTLQEIDEKDHKKLMRRREKEDRELESGYESSKEKSMKMKKKTEHEKQMYTKNIENKKISTQQKQRETGRQLVSTKVKMEDTGEHLSYLNKSLDVTRTDLKSIQLQKRLKAAGDRKLNLSLDTSVGKTDQQLEDALIKAWNNEIESRRYIMDDVRTRLEKIVTQREKRSQGMSQEVRTLGLNRNNQEKQVRELERKLERLRHENQRKMLQQLADQKTQERKLEEELLRKKGDLISTHSKRDDTYQGLVREKEILRRDQEVLTDIERKKKVSGRVSSGDDKSDKKKPSMLELGEIMYAEHFCARVNAKKFKGKTAKDITDKDLRTHCNCMSNITLEGDGKNFDHCCLKIYQWLQELAQDQRKLDKLVNDKDSDPVMQFFRKYRERAGKCFNSGTFEPPRTDTLLATNVQSNMGLLVICTVAMMHPIIGD